MSADQVAKLKEPEEVEVQELPYDLFGSSIFYFRQLVDDLCRVESDIDSNDSQPRAHFPSDAAMAEIVLPVAFRGLIIHLMNPQLLSLDEHGTIQIMHAII